MISVWKTNRKNSIISKRKKLLQTRLFLKQKYSLGGKRHTYPGKLFLKLRSKPLPEKGLKECNANTMKRMRNNNYKPQEYNHLLFLFSISSRFAVWFMPMEVVNDSNVSVKQLCARYDMTMLWTSLSLTAYGRNPIISKSQVRHRTKPLKS